MKYFVFDIETGPDEERIDRIMSGMEFKPDSRLKDPSKIEASIEAKRNKFRESASLSPYTGKVLAIGIYDGAVNVILDYPDESQILKEWWQIYRAEIPQCKFIGHNIYDFDLPFLIVRSRMHKVFKRDPDTEFTSNRMNQNRAFVDTMIEGSCGSKNMRCKLDTMARSLGVGGKNGDGSQFAELFSGGPQDRKEAINYLKNDLLMTWRVAEAIGQI